MCVRFPDCPCGGAPPGGHKKVTRLCGACQLCTSELPGTLPIPLDSITFYHSYPPNVNRNIGVFTDGRDR